MTISKPPHQPTPSGTAMPPDGSAGADAVAEFEAWLPDPMTVYVRLTRDHDQWYAEALEFEIVGIAESLDDSRLEMFRLLYAYLRSCHTDRRSFQQARRPGRLTHRLKVQALAGISRLTRARLLRVERITFPPREQVLSLA